MSDYLQRLAESVSSTQAPIRPALRSLFEPNQPETAPPAGAGADDSPSTGLRARFSAASTAIRERVASVQGLWPRVSTGSGADGQADPPSPPLGFSKESQRSGSAGEGQRTESGVVRAGDVEKGSGPSRLQPANLDAEAYFHAVRSRVANDQSRALAPSSGPPDDAAATPLTATTRRRERGPAERVAERGWPESSRAAPTIQVTIGRIEIRAVTKASAPAAGSRGTTGLTNPPKLSLDDYLRKRNGGSA